MNDFLLPLIQKYKSQGILVDANVAILYVVGSLNPELIRDSKRTAMFTEADFEKVSRFIDYFPSKVTTPNVLTEVSDLLPKTSGLLDVFSGFVRNSLEKYSPSGSLIDSIVFSDFGLADASVYETARQNYLILTDDKPLASFLSNKNVDVVSLDAVRFI